MEILRMDPGPRLRGYSQVSSFSCGRTHAFFTRQERLFNSPRGSFISF